MLLEITITARGHQHIKSTHRSTWQLTTEDHLTPQGDCIVAIEASHAAKDLPPQMQRHLNNGGWIEIILRTDTMTYTGKGQGHSDLEFKHPTDMVFRRSNYTCERTITINTSFVAAQIPREMIDQLTDPQQEIEIILRTIPTDTEQ